MSMPIKVLMSGMHLEYTWTCWDSLLWCSPAYLVWNTWQSVISVLISSMQNSARQEESPALLQYWLGVTLQQMTTNLIDSPLSKASPLWLQILCDNRKHNTYTIRGLWLFLNGNDHIKHGLKMPIVFSITFDVGDHFSFTPKTFVRKCVWYTCNASWYFYNNLSHKVDTDLLGKKGKGSQFFSHSDYCNR